MKLPFKRFIAQASTAPARSKSSYLAMMAENLEALKRCQWRKAANVPASLTGHDFTASTQFSDAYDAYKLTGNYDSKAMTEIAYAGMAAYRFTLPEAYVQGTANITTISVPVARDRFCKGGVRVAVALSDSAEPSGDWDVVRGGSGVAPSAEAVFAQSAEDAPYLTASEPASGEVAFDIAAGTRCRYLWIYLTLEDYCDAWEWYNAKERRLYAVEGSGMVIGQRLEVAFDADVEEDEPEPEAVYAVCQGGALPEAGEGPFGVCVATQYTGDAVPTSPDDRAYKDAPFAASALGLRLAYAALYAGQAAELPPAKPRAMRPGAKFLVDAANRCWRVQASALVVPFATPFGFKATRLRLSWGACGASVTPGLTWRVWVKDGSASLAMPALADAGFWVPGSKSADGFTLAGEFAASAAAGTAEVPVEIDAPLATVAVTGFLSMDGVDPATASGTKFGCAEEFRPSLYLLP